MFAGCTIACRSTPSVSTKMCRFLPLMSLPPSNPCGSIRPPSHGGSCCQAPRETFLDAPLSLNCVSILTCINGMEAPPCSGRAERSTPYAPSALKARGFKGCRLEVDSRLREALPYFQVRVSGSESKCARDSAAANLNVVAFRLPRPNECRGCPRQNTVAQRDFVTPSLRLKARDFDPRRGH